MLLSNLWSNPFDNAIEIFFSEIFDALPSLLQDLIVAFTNLGDSLIFLILLGVILVMFKKTRKLGIACFLGLIFTFIINELILKDIFDRTRPFADPDLVDQLVSVVNNGGIPYGTVPDSSSFPSGHTFGAFTIFGTSTFYFIFKKDPEEHKVYKKFFIFFAVFAPLMGLSRILVSHHYTTDVIAGAILGYAVGIGIYYLIEYTPKLIKLIINKIKNKKEVPAEETSTESNIEE